MTKKIVLAYSGGLDTSVILKWLQLNYECPVATYTANIGQNDNFDEIKLKAKNLGVHEIYVEDWWAFPRSPQVINLKWNVYEIILINNHYLEHLL